jgi:hypothetical protein
MAEVEYEGLKVTGGRLLLILPMLSALVAGGWGIFEVYQRLLTAEEVLETIDVVGIQAEVNRLESIAEVIQSSLQNQIQNIEDNARTENSSMRAEFADFARLLREVEASTSTTQRELRNDIYGLERDTNERLRSVDDNLIEMRAYLEARIQEILTNPLNNIE